MDTEAIDRLFLELSQFTNATTDKELQLQRQIDQLQERLNDFEESIMSWDKETDFRAKTEKRAVIVALSVDRISVRHY
jgi:DNA-binding PadR family transcriptional regulator